MADEYKDILGRNVPFNTSDITQSASKKDLGALKPYMKEANKQAEDSNDTLNEIKKILQKLSKSFQNDLSQAKKYAGDIKDAVKKISSGKVKTGAASMGGGGGKGGKINIKDAGDAGKDAGNKFTEGFLKKSAFAGISAAIASTLSKFNILGDLFSGVISQELEFMQQMRATAYEVDGISASTRGLQESWQETGKVVKQTGVSLTKFQQQYVKNLRSGFITQKATLSITKTGLNLSTMIGSNAEQTSDTLMSWHKTLGLNDIQMSQLNRNLQDTARLTGVTGDALMNAVKSSEKLAENLRDTSMLTASAAANLAGMMASAEKLGVGGKVSEIGDAITSMDNLFNKADPKIQGWVLRAGALSGTLQQVMTGTVTQTKSGMKAFAAGAKADIESIMRVSFDEYKNLTDLQQASINMVLKRARGVGVGQAERIIKSFEEQAMTYGDRIADINKQLKGSNLTLEERIKLEEDRSRIEMNAGFELLTSFSEAAKTSKSLADAAKDTISSNSDLQENLKSLGVDITQPMQAVEKMAMLTAKKISEAGGKDFSTEIRKALASGDAVELRTVLGDMNKAQQELGVDTKKGLDPISDLAQTVMEINEEIRGFTGPVVRYLAGAVLILGTIAATVASIAVTVGSIAMAVGGMGMAKGILGGLMGRGAGAAAGTAGNVAGTVAGGAGGAGDLGKLNILGSLKTAGPMLLKAAAGLAIAGAAVVVLIKILQLVGIDSKQAWDATKTIIAILTSIMAIATAMLSIMGITALMDKFSKTIPGMLTSLITGGIVLALATPIIMTLGLAVMGLAKGVLALAGLFGLTPEQAVEIGEQVASILMSTAKILIAVGLALAVIAAIGAVALGPQALFLAAALAVGALVIMGMTPAILMMSMSIVGLAQEITSAGNITPEEADKIAGNVVSILSSTSKIIMSVSWMMTELMAIGVASASAFLMGAWLWVPLGIAAITISTPYVLALASAIVELANATMEKTGLTAEEASKTAENVSNIIESLGTIITGVSGTVAMLEAIGFKSAVDGVMSFFTGGLFGSMELGAAYLKDMVPKLLSFSKEMFNSITSSMGETGSPENTKKVVDTIENMSRAISAIGNILETSSEKFDDLASGSWFGLGDSTLDNLEEALPSIKNTLIVLKKFLAEIAVSVLGNVNTSALKTGADALQSMSSMVTPMAELLGDSGQKLVDVANDPWFSDSVLTNIEQAMPALTRTVIVMAAFLDGIASGLKMVLGSGTENMSSSIDSLRVMSNMIGEIISIMNGEEGKGGIAKLTKSKGGFLFWGGSTIMEDFMTSLNDGIITPLEEGLPKTSKMGPLANKLFILADVFTNLATALKALSEAAKELNGPELKDLDAKKLGQLLDKVAKIMPGKTLSGARAMGEEVSSSIARTRHITNSATERVYHDGLEENSKTIENAASTAKIDTSTAIDVANQAVNNAAEKVEAATPGMVSRIGSVFASILDAATGGIGSVISNAASAIGLRVPKVLDTAPEDKGGVGLNVGRVKTLAEFQRKVNEAKLAQSSRVAGQLAYESAEPKHYKASGSGYTNHSDLNVSESIKKMYDLNASGANVSSAPVMDAYDRINQDKSSTAAGVSKSNGKELSTIEGASLEQVGHQIQTNKLLQTLVQIFQQKPSGSAAPADLSLKSSSGGPTNYGSWPTGLSTGNASTQVIT